MFLTSPLMLLGLLTLPVLAGIYWLRSRSQRVMVSSLMLWVDQRRPRQGGRILHRMQTPLTFFLELLALAFLVLAAAGPTWPQRNAVRSLLVVLDDSYSMRAAGADGTVQSAPRQQAAAAVCAEIARSNYVVRWILAGPRPRLLGEPTRTAAQAAALLQAWECQDAAADLSAAIALAAEVGGPTARILVLTDQPPPATIEGGQVQWWAFGAAQPNLALTAATRTLSGDHERVLLEVANLSDQPTRSVLRLEGGNLSGPREETLQLAPHATRQFFISLPIGAPAFQAALGADALEPDNHATLLPEFSKPLRVRLDLADDALKTAVSRALAATQQTLETDDRPELVIAAAAGAPADNAWRLEILGGEEPQAFIGPFVIDHNHPLTEGLALQNTVWSASAKTPLRGQPLIAAGNTALLTDSVNATDQHHLRMGFVEAQSNLQDMPDWPILFANLVRWRRRELPGVATPNVRLGQTLTVTLPHDAEQIELLAPTGAARLIVMRGRKATVPADRLGIHTVKDGETTYSFACNALAREESDLGRCVAGHWGNWDESPIYQDHYASLGWILILAALAVLTGHLLLVARSVGGNNT